MNRNEFNSTLILLNFKQIKFAKHCWINYPHKYCFDNFYIRYQNLDNLQLKTFTNYTKTVEFLTRVT